MNIELTLLYLHASATSVMLAVIWFVQLIRYPSFRLVPAHQFAAYHRRYTTRIGLIVGPTMTLELLTGTALLTQSSGTRFTIIASGMCLLVLIWISTAVVQIPCHNFLGRGFDQDRHRLLVKTNWIRTISWSVRWVLVISALVIANGA